MGVSGKMAKPRLLLTGASGFIGRHVLGILTQARRFDIHCVSSNADHASAENVHWHLANLLRENDRQSLIKDIRPTHLLHLAWYTEHGKVWESPENHDWVTASESIAEEFGRFGGKRAVFAGTCAEYEWGGNTILNETLSPTRPKSLYGQCKIAAHDKIASLAASSRFEFAWARIFFLYGPDEDPKRFVSFVARKLMQGEEAPLTHGEQVRDFLHVDDVADAFVSLLEHDFTGTVNIGSGQAVTLGSLAKTVATLLGADEGLLKFGAMEAPPNEPHVLLPDLSLIMRELDWRPQWTLDAGLKKFIQDLKSR
jgi:nucleoside-diphosphate-sugar epimerase